MSRNNAGPGTPSPKSRTRRSSPTSSLSLSSSNRTPRRRPNRVLTPLRFGGINTNNVPEIFEGNGYVPNYKRTIISAITGKPLRISKEGDPIFQPRPSKKLGKAQRFNRKLNPNGQEGPTLEQRWRMASRKLIKVNKQRQNAANEQELRMARKQQTGAIRNEFLGCLEQRFKTFITQLKVKTRNKPQENFPTLLALSKSLSKHMFGNKGCVNQTKLGKNKRTFGPNAPFPWAYNGNNDPRGA